MIQRRLATVAGAITIALVLGACGGGGGLVSEAASAELTPRVTEIRDLSAGGHPEFAAAKLAELALLVQQLLDRGDLSDEGAVAVLAAASEVQAQLQLVTTTTSTTTVPPPTAPPPPEADDEERGNGGGNGRGRDRDD